MMMVAYLLLTLLIIEVTIIVHELGHLRTARKHGVKVNDFSIGMGKTLKQWTMKDGMTISLKLFPVGGSVSPSGMTVEEVEKKNLDKETSYIYATPMKRFRITVAGVGYNMALFLVTELVLVMFYLNPTKPSELLAIPSIMFWVSAALIGIFIQILIVAPFNGFENMGSVITMPTGVNNTITAANETGMPMLITICMIIMIINLFMAIVNSLPIYPFDGFFMSTAIADGARKNVKQEKYTPLTMHRLRWLVLAGYSTSLALVSYLMLRDLWRLITAS